MFGKENQYGTVAGFTVRVKDEREKDRNHLVEVSFELPLTFELADEISPAIARDLFNEIKGEWTPKPEISTLGMNISPAQQLMTLREHPDLDPQVKIAGVTVRKIVAKKGEANTWLLTFTATWTLGDPKEAITMIQRLKMGVYLTFVEQEPQLDLSGNQGDIVDGEVVDGQKANVDEGGNVVGMTPKKRKRAGRRTPEQEGQDQEAEARKALPPADDAAEQPATE
jgi:hypothetical protein